MAKKNANIALDAKWVNKMLVKFNSSTIDGCSLELLTIMITSCDDFKNKLVGMTDELKAKRIEALEYELKLLKGEIKL